MQSEGLECYIIVNSLQACLAGQRGYVKIRTITHFVFGFLEVKKKTFTSQVKSQHVELRRKAISQSI